MFYFLFILSAPGPGWQRFGYIKYLGAPEKFVGGVGWVVGQHLVNASQKVTLGHVRANSLTIIEFINHIEEIELKDI